MMKKTMILLLAALLLALSACREKGEDPGKMSRFTLINGFEDYNKDMTLNTYAGMVGELKLVSGGEYVTQGEKCLEMNIRYSSDISWKPFYTRCVVCAPRIVFYGANIGISDVSDIDYFSADVFNPNKKDVSFYLQLEDETGEIIYGKLVTVNAGCKKTAMFGICGAFEDERFRNVSRFVLGILDARINEGNTVIYIDNFGYVKRAEKEIKEDMPERLPCEICSLTTPREVSCLDTFYTTTTPVAFLSYSPAAMAAKLCFAGFGDTGVEAASLRSHTQRAGVRFTPGALDVKIPAGACRLSYELKTENAPFTRIYTEITCADDAWTLSSDIKDGVWTRVVVNVPAGHDLSGLEGLALFFDVNNVSCPCRAYIRNVSYGGVK